MTLNNNKLGKVPFVKLLPNLVTLIGLTVGISSIRFALDQAWEKAVYCILVATIIDGLDGRVARIFNATSQFGAELDSLCDFVNFGVSPALLIYLWSFQQYEYKVISWFAIMIFIVCMAIRLARFNTTFLATKDKSEDKSLIDDYFFTGIPAPSGALLALIPLILDFELTGFLDNFTIRTHTLAINAYIAFIAFLMASRLPTVSFKKLQIKQEYLSVSMAIFAVMIIIMVIYPWYLLPVIAVIYLCSIPVCALISKKIIFK